MKHILIKCDTHYDGSVIRVILAELEIENKRFSDDQGYIYIYAKVDLIRWIILKRKLEKELIAGAQFDILERL